MKTTQNYSMEDLAELLVKATLEETFLKRETLIPKFKAIIKTMIDLKNVPKNYNSYESKTTQARRLRTIEQKDAEIKFWLRIVKEIDGVNIEKHYRDSQSMLIEKGFINPEPLKP